MIRPAISHLSISRVAFRTSTGTSSLSRSALAIVLLFALAVAPRLIPAQQQKTSTSSAATMMQQLEAQDTIFRGRGDTIPGDREDPTMRERRLKAMNAQRQKAMVDDTDKLLKLTAQLDAEVSSNHSQTLNADQLRRVAEIEKLAKSVREKMTDAIGPPPRSMEPPNMMGDKAPYAY